MSAVPRINEVTGPLVVGESAASPAVNQTLPAEYLEPRWYAAYTRAQHERRVAELLRLRGVESFLPLYQRLHQWKNRQRVWVQLPLFPGYVFVRLALCDRLQVLQIPSVVHLVGCNGFPTALPDSEIEALHRVLLRQLRAEPCDYLTIGQRIRIVRGPLQGIEGILIRKKSTLRVVLSVNLIMRSAAVEINSEDVEPLRGIALRREGQMVDRGLVVDGSGPSHRRCARRAC